MTGGADGRLASPLNCVFAGKPEDVMKSLSFAVLKKCFARKKDTVAPMAGSVEQQQEFARQQLAQLIQNCDNVSKASYDISMMLNQYNKVIEYYLYMLNFIRDNALEKKFTAYIKEQKTLLGGK